jgi:2-polyprenyl-3-methyl-5-hydroxy-6-metoxy-1,4-benzoquinol methylase
MPIFQVKDNLVSGEFFPVLECGGCTLRLTQDVPGPDEIAPYYKSEAYVSHSNTRKGMVNWLYHQVRKRTLVKKRKWIEKWTGKMQGDLLDVGAGSGAFVGAMKENGWKVRGLEPDPDARAVALQDHGIVLDDISQLFDLPETQFDAITLWHVLEHVHALQDYMAKMARLIKPEGAIFVAVPNYTSGDARHFGEHWAAYDVPRHLYHFSPASMQVLAAKHGLKIEAQLPMKFDSFYVSLLSYKHKSGSSRWLSSFWQGLSSNWKAGKYGASSIVYVLRST